MIPDQTVVWNEKHDDGDHKNLRNKPSSFCLMVEPKIPRHSHVLELGCGVGRDSSLLSKKGHHVTATDISDVVIKQNKEYFGDTDINFEVLDIRESLPYESKSFEVVFANLSLHYYTDNQTHQVVQEVLRVLKNGGIFAFACKSINDLNYGNGVEVEKNIFVSNTGHVRHLFSIEYAEELLLNELEIIHLDEIEEEYNGVKSNIVRCIAKKMEEA